MPAFDSRDFDPAAFETETPKPNVVYGIRRGRVTEWTIIPPSAA